MPRSRFVSGQGFFLGAVWIGSWPIPLIQIPSTGAIEHINENSLAASSVLDKVPRNH